MVAHSSAPRTLKWAPAVVLLTTVAVAAAAAVAGTADAAAPRLRSSTSYGRPLLQNIAASGAVTQKSDIDALVELYLQWMQHPAGWPINATTLAPMSDPCSASWPCVSCGAAGNVSRVIGIELQSPACSNAWGNGPAIAITLDATVLPKLTALQRLDVHGRNFRCTALGNLIRSIPTLKYLDVNSIDVSGTLGNIGGSQLEVLNCSNTHVGGAVYELPASLTHLIAPSTHVFRLPRQLPPALVDLEMGSAELNQSLSSLNLGSLRHLERLLLSENQLHGSVPSFANLSCLSDLLLNSNSLSGSLPMLPVSLERVDLSSNAFAGQIPDTYGQLANLQSLSLSSNTHLSGGVPITFRGLKQLQSIDLSDCGLNSDVMPWAALELPELRELNLAENSLGGKTPGTVKEANLSYVLERWLSNTTALPRLQIVDLSSIPALYGTLPRALAHRRWVEVTLDNLHMSGTIPSWLYDIDSLQLLSLSFSGISGVISPTIERMKALKTLQLDSLPNHRGLHGQIPPQLWTLPSLTTLTLSGNHRLGGDFSQVGNATLLTELNVQGCAVTGTLPDSIGDCTQLSTLQLSGTRLSGTLPSSLNELQALRDFSAQHTRISGAWPFLSMPDLTTLDLSHTSLSGTIPLNVHLPSLETLLLSGSGLSGLLPHSLLTASPSLVTYDVSFNEFHGDLPGEASLENLIVLNVSGTNLTGSIPNWVFGSRSLAAVDLSQAQFSGNITPPSWRTMCQAHVLDLTGNSDLAWTIPSEIATAPMLNSLLLANSGVYGTLPASWEALHCHDASTLSMESMALGSSSGRMVNVFLADNKQIVGELPGSLTAQSGLINLNVNNCSLSGELSNHTWGESLRFVSLSANGGRGGGFSGNVPLGLLSRHPNVNTVLMAANTLNGELPQQLSPQLSVLDVSYNSLSGPLPALENLTIFIAAHNNIGGELTPALAANRTVTQSVLELKLNRISGWLDGVDVNGSAWADPERSSQDHKLDILIGNLFDCGMSEDVRDFDVGFKSYLCPGIASLAPPLIILSISLTAFVSAAVYRLVDSRKAERRRSRAKSLSFSAMPRPTGTAAMMATAYRQAALWAIAMLACFGGLVTLYTSMNSVYQHRFYLSYSISFLGNSSTDTASWVLGGVLLLPPNVLAAWWHVHRLARFSDKFDLHGTEAESSRPDPKWCSPCSCRRVCRLLAVCGMVSGALLLCATPNAIFVAMQHAPSFSQTEKRLAKAGVAVIKTLLNTILLSFVARFATSFLATQAVVGAQRRVKQSHMHLRMTAILQHINTVIIPLFAVLLVHPRCFYYAWSPQSPTRTNITYSLCPSWSATCSKPLYHRSLRCGKECYDVAKGNCNVECATAESEWTPVREVSTVEYPWRWDRSCPSTLVQLYGGVYLTSLILQGLLSSAVRIARSSPTSMRKATDLHSEYQRRKPATRIVQRLLLNPLGTVESGYVRLFNVMEMTLVLGTLDSFVGFAGCVAVLCLWHATWSVAPNPTAGRGRSAPRVVVAGYAHGVPMTAVSLTLLMYSVMVGLFLAGGDVFAPEDWTVGVGIGVACLVLSGTTLLMGEVLARRGVFIFAMCCSSSPREPTRHRHRLGRSSRSDLTLPILHDEVRREPQTTTIESRADSGLSRVSEGPPAS